MRKLIVPIQFIVIMASLAFNAYAEQPRERITTSLGMELVLIRPGKFMMGSPKGMNLIKKGVTRFYKKIIQYQLIHV